MTHKFPRCNENPLRADCCADRSHTINYRFSLSGPIAKSASVFIGLYVVSLTYIIYQRKRDLILFHAMATSVTPNGTKYCTTLREENDEKLFIDYWAAQNCQGISERTKKVLQPSENKVSYLNANPFVNLETGIHFNFKS